MTTSVFLITLRTRPPSGHPQPTQDKNARTLVTGDGTTQIKPSSRPNTAEAQASPAAQRGRDANDSASAAAAAAAAPTSAERAQKLLPPSPCASDSGSARYGGSWGFLTPSTTRWLGLGLGLGLGFGFGLG